MRFETISDQLQTKYRGEDRTESCRQWQKSDDDLRFIFPFYPDTVNRADHEIIHFFEEEESPVMISHRIPFDILFSQILFDAHHRIRRQPECRLFMRDEMKSIIRHLYQ